MRVHALVANSILALAIAGAASAADKAEEPIKLDFAWKLSLDAQGHVAQLTAITNKRSDRVPQVRDRIEQAIRSWAFVSGKVDGRPAPTDTHLSVSISLVPNDENSYRIAFDNVRTGGSVLKAAPPHYPESAVRDRKTGMVVLRVDYDADGKTVKAALDPDAPPIDKALVDASIDVVMKKWTFQPELVDGHGIPGTQVLPICYSIFEVPVHSRNPAPGCLWRPPGNRAAIGQGDSLAINPVAHLAVDVAGHAL
jgi:TonB family protein